MRSQSILGLSRWVLGVLTVPALSLSLLASTAEGQPLTPLPGTSPQGAPGALPPLPNAPPPAASPPPSGAVPDVTILPPLPPAPEAPPPPAAPLPLVPPPANATSNASSTATATVIVNPATQDASLRPLRPHGFSFGLRLAIGLPLGSTDSIPTSTAANADVDGTSALGDQFGVIIPVTLDVGYRINPHWYVGGYFSFGYGTPSGYCSANSVECDQNDIRFGVDGKYSVSPAAFVDPWIGAGFGWEIANNATDDFAGEANGPEFLHVRAGLDFRMTPHLFLGPEAMFTMDVFTNHLGINSQGNSVSAALHDWLTLGVSGHYDL